MESSFKDKKIEELTFAVVGLGLIGGSYAKALRRLGVREIIGVEKDIRVLQYAAELGIIDAAMPFPDRELTRADVIICAIYPEAIEEFVRESAGFMGKRVLLTDAAGIKGNLITRVQELLPSGAEFISGHPMAGRQGSGIAMADDEIFRGANYIIVPEKHNSEEAVNWLEDFAVLLGCSRTVRVTPAEHDRIIAFTSNLPHITAVALMNSPSFDEKTQYFIAGSFRDGTRVADINPELWSSLFLANREKVAEEIKLYMEQLDLWRGALLAGDGAKMQEFMRKAGARRRGLS